MECCTLGVLVLRVDAGAQVEFGALEGVRLELLGMTRVHETVRKDDGAVAVKVLRIVVRSITWSSSKLVVPLGGACIGTPCLAGRWKLCLRCRPPKASRNCSPSPLLIIGKPSTHSSSRRCHCPLVSRFVPRTYGSPERDPERPQKTEKRQRGIPKLKLKPEKVRRVYLFSVPHFAIRAYLLRLPPHPPLRSSAPS